MRILVGTGEPLGAGGNSYWRLIVPFSRLKDHTVLFTDGTDRRVFESADVVVLTRDGGIEVMKHLVGIGHPVIMDFDDNLHTMNSDNGARHWYSNGKDWTKRFEEALGVATIVTTSTPRLAADYARFRKDIRICPNFIPDDIFERLRPAKITGEPKSCGCEIRVGYAGGRTHLADLRMVWKPLKKLCKRYPQVRIVCFGQMPPEEYGWLEDRLEYHDVVLEWPGESRYEHMDRYFAELKSLDLDIAIAPLLPTVFNAGKSYLKAMEYGACGYPMVASSFGPYREYAAQGGALSLAFDEAEWFRNLSWLVEDQAARRDLAERNLQHVHERHGTAAGIKPWLQSLDAASASRSEPETSHAGISEQPAFAPAQTATA